MPVPCLEQDRRLGDRLRVGADDRVVEARLPAEPLDRAQRVGDRFVLVAVADVGPREHVLRKRSRGRECGPEHRSTTAARDGDERGDLMLMRDYWRLDRPRRGVAFGHARAPT